MPVGWAEFDWRRSLKVAGHVALTVWFAYWTWQILRFYFESFPYHMDMVGFDSRIYLHAAQTWLAGGDPWTAFALAHSWGGGDVPYYFTGPPPTVLAFVPFAWLPDGVFTGGWMALTIGSAFYSLWRLRLPLWWILFPPLAQAVFVGNPHVVCLALILCGWDGLRILAPAAKAYAVLPMIGEGQWRALGVLVGAGVLSLVLFWPLYMQYLADYPHVQDWISSATWGGFSATRDPRLFAVAAAAIGVLVLIDRRAAGWLAVPALWPAAEYFYASFALPIRSPWLLAALAVTGSQADAYVPWAIVAYVVVRLAQTIDGYGARPAEAADGSDGMPGDAEVEGAG